MLLLLCWSVFALVCAHFGSPGRHWYLTERKVVGIWLHECYHGPLNRYVKLRVMHVPGMPGTLSPSPRVGDPDMHHGTCATHEPWCMPGSLTSGFIWSRWREKTFTAFPAHAHLTILHILEEAHWSCLSQAHQLPKVPAMFGWRVATGVSFRRSSNEIFLGRPLFLQYD